MTHPNPTNPTPTGWTPESWRARLEAQQVRYDDPAAVAGALDKLRAMPPLVTSWEIERLKHELAQAGRGERFILHGGDCAETLGDCRPEIITNKLKILLQMSLVLIHGLKVPVTRIGRFAGQYAKPRSNPIETRTVDGAEVTLPSYFGDLVNRPAFEPEARKPNPELMVTGYQHAAMTLNFIRSLLEGGFADLHHPEYWDLSFFAHADLPPEQRRQYEAMAGTLADGISFMENLGEARVHELTRAEFYTSHEGLNLLYESAQTRGVPRRDGYWDLTAHMPWIGERTRQIDGAHVEFFRGICNPVGVKIGPGATGNDLHRLIEALNPAREPGRLVFIARMGEAMVACRLPALLEAVADEPITWLCDPMHGNGVTTAGGIKTRNFDAIESELEQTIDLHAKAGTNLGGVSIELTGEDVTECVGGAAGVGEDDLGLNYLSPCDPRLNYQQSLELAFVLAGKMGSGSI